MAKSKSVRQLESIYSDLETQVRYLKSRYEASTVAHRLGTLCDDLQRAIRDVKEEMTELEEE